MPTLIKADSELDGLAKLLDLIVSKGRWEGSYKEILGCLISIPFCKSSWLSFQKFQADFLEETGKAGVKGLARATRVYTNPKHRPQKPSYLGRMIAYPDHPRKSPETTQINQMSTIAEEMSQKPGYSCLTFTVLRPADLVDKFRPGYVPCLTSGDFKFRRGLLHFNASFRTQDSLLIGYADLFHLRAIQMSILDSAINKTRSTKLQNGQLGDLNIYLARAFIPRYILHAEGKKEKGLDTAERLSLRLRHAQTALTSDNGESRHA